jgi:hypothetical protein
MLPPPKPGGKLRRGKRVFTPLRPLYKVENAFAQLLAGVGAGVFPSAAAAAETCVRIGETRAPDPRARSLYDERYTLYRGLYPALAPFNQRLSRRA